MFLIDKSLHVNCTVIMEPKNSNCYALSMSKTVYSQLLNFLEPFNVVFILTKCISILNMKNRNQPVETSEHFNYTIKTYMQYHWGWWRVPWLWKTSGLVTFPKTKHHKHLSSYRPVIVICWSMNSPEGRVRCGPTCHYHMSLSWEDERMSVSENMRRWGCQMHRSHTEDRPAPIPLPYWQMYIWPGVRWWRQGQVCL